MKLKHFLMAAYYVFVAGIIYLAYSIISVGYTAVLARRYGFDFIFWNNAKVVLSGLLGMILALVCAWLLRSAAKNVNKE